MSTEVREGYLKDIHFQGMPEFCHHDSDVFCVDYDCGVGSECVLCPEDETGIIFDRS